MIIETQNLKKLYRTELVETTALDAVSVSVDARQFVSIMGRPVRGKSTFAALPSRPQVARRANGLLPRFAWPRTVSRYPESKRAADPQAATSALIFQSVQSDRRELTVYDERGAARLVYAKISAARAQKEGGRRARSAWTSVIAAEHMPGQLSGGQQQRVAVARRGSRTSRT